MSHIYFARAKAKLAGGVHGTWLEPLMPAFCAYMTQLGFLVCPLAFCDSTPARRHAPEAARFTLHAVSAKPACQCLSSAPLALPYSNAGSSAPPLLSLNVALSVGHTPMRAAPHLLAWV